MFACQFVLLLIISDLIHKHNKKIISKLKIERGLS